MIVVDTNVIAYLHLPGAHTESAREAIRRDPEWAAPLLWRSEFRNVLLEYIRGRHLALADAVVVQRTAESILEGREFGVDSPAVLERASASGLSAYDCEFVVLAASLRLQLVTSDRRVLRAAPNVAVSLADFAEGK